MMILKIQGISLLIHVFLTLQNLFVLLKKKFKIPMDGIGNVFLIGSVRLTLLELSVLGCPFLPPITLMESELTRTS